MVVSGKASTEYLSEDVVEGSSCYSKDKEKAQLSINTPLFIKKFDWPDLNLFDLRQIQYII